MGEEIAALQRQFSFVVRGGSTCCQPLARHLELHGPIPEDLPRHELHDPRSHRARLPCHSEGALARQVQLIDAIAKEITHEVI